ncbi:hypothetical protein C8J56DRAFT_1042261 [Mycena floridula]|nr:hypothetical protein C8J56DRAFT_1042261 [Mycena floridula]
MSRKLPVVKFTDSKDHDPFNYISDYEPKQILTEHLTHYVLAGSASDCASWVQCAVSELWARFIFQPPQLIGAFSLHEMECIAHAVTEYKAHFTKQVKEEFIQAQRHPTEYMAWASLLQGTFDMRIMIPTLAPFVRGENHDPGTVPFEWLVDHNPLRLYDTSQTHNPYIVDFIKDFFSQLPASNTEIRVILRFGFINTPSSAVNTAKMLVMEIKELFYQQVKQEFKKCQTDRHRDWAAMFVHPDIKIFGMGPEAPVPLTEVTVAQSRRVSSGSIPESSQDYGFAVTDYTPEFLAEISRIETSYADM